MTAKGGDRVRDILANATAGPSSSSDALARAALHGATMLAPEDSAGPGPDGFDAPPPWDEIEDDAEPSDTRAERVDPEVVAECARLDQSDTDNGRRLLLHFGDDMLVLETEGVASADYLVWTGKHWDGASGNDASIRTAQRVGARIALEADYLAYSLAELTMVKRAEPLLAKEVKDLTPAERQAVEDAKAVPTALAGRRKSRRAFGVTTKNQGRIANMLRMAAPHITRKPDAFNHDPMLVAVDGHTLRFRRERVEDLENPDPDSRRFISEAALEVTEGHDRAHLITKLMPVAYDPAARCPLWDAFLDEFLPDPAVRRMVQVFSGLGMTGIGLQRVMFHYGSGANGKSAFMETLMRVMGPLGVGLPAASLVGESKATGNQANPDIARLYGARIVRVAELPPNEPVKEELVKLLTGGERMPARNLFKGFFEFTPVFKAHLSGNGLPRIDGTDNGIWRRMVVVPWVKTIPEERRRDLHEVVAEFVTEGSGILNWMVEGVLIFIREGFVVPEAARTATQDYRDEMDPVGQFVNACVKESAGNKVQASTMYTAYETWCLANGMTAFKQTAFGRKIKQKLTRVDTGGLRFFTDCVLHSVPARPAPDYDDR